MKEVTAGVWFIPGRDEMIPDAHMYVIGDPTGKDLTLVDAGLVGKGAYKLAALQKLNLPLGDVRRIIMTHTHLDHIGCLPELLEAMPQAEVWVHASEADQLEKGDERTVYGMDMFQSMVQSQYGLKLGAFKIPVQRRLADGETLDLGGTVWQVAHIPGHSMGSIALYDAARRILIPGDTVYADYAIGRFDLYGASGPQLKASLLKLAELDVAVLLPGHNRIVEQVQPGYILNTAKQWGPYLY